MSSEEKEFSQLDSPSNGETFVASPPPYTQSSGIPVGTSAPVINDTLPASTPLADKAAYATISVGQPPVSTPLADKAAYATTSVGQPPIAHQPHAVTQQYAYHPTNFAATGTAPAFIQHPRQAPYYGPGVVQFASPINAQPTGIPLQPSVQIIQRQKTVDVPDEMRCSIVSTFCCCLLLGIPAMILASQANSLRHVDPQRALSKARAARGLNIASFILGTAIIIAFVVMRSMSATSTSTYY